MKLLEKDKEYSPEYHNSLPLKYKEALTPDIKLKYIEEWIQSSPNYKYLKNNPGASVAIQNAVIEEDSLDPKENPLLDFVDNKLNSNVTYNQLDLIQNLISNDSINKSNMDYILNVFGDIIGGIKDENDSLFYIKAETFLTNPELYKKYSSKKPQMTIYDRSGNLRSRPQIQQYLNRFQTKEPTQEYNRKENQPNISNKDIRRSMQDNNIKNVIKSLHDYKLTPAQIGLMLSVVDILPKDNAENIVRDFLKGNQ